MTEEEVEAWRISVTADALRLYNEGLIKQGDYHAMLDEIDRKATKLMYQEPLE